MSEDTPRIPEPRRAWAELHAVPPYPYPHAAATWGAADPGSVAHTFSPPRPDPDAVETGGEPMHVTTPPNPYKRGSLNYALWAMFTSGFALGRQTTGDLDTDQAFTLMCRALADAPGTVTRAEP